MAKAGIHPKPILYGFWKSSCTWRVRIALNLKKVEYESRPVLPEARNTSAYRTLNPSGKVPILVHKGHKIAESTPIIEFLEEQYPDGTPLIPGDVYERGTARTIANHITSNVQPLLHSRVVEYLNQGHGGSGLEWSTYWCENGFTELEALIRQYGGKYCVRNKLTIADLCIPGLVYKARSIGVDPSQFMHIDRIDKTLNEIPEFKLAHADSQPDRAK